MQKLSIAWMNRSSARTDHSWGDQRKLCIGLRDDNMSRTSSTWWLPSSMPVRRREYCTQSESQCHPWRTSPWLRRVEIAWRDNVTERLMPWAYRRIGFSAAKSVTCRGLSSLGCGKPLKNTYSASSSATSSGILLYHMQQVLEKIAENKGSMDTNGKDTLWSHIESVPWRSKSNIYPQNF